MLGPSEPCQLPQQTIQTSAGGGSPTSRTVVENYDLSKTGKIETKKREYPPPKKFLSVVIRKFEAICTGKRISCKIKEQKRIMYDVIMRKNNLRSRIKLAQMMKSCQNACV